MVDVVVLVCACAFRWRGAIRNCMTDLLLECCGVWGISCQGWMGRAASWAAIWRQPPVRVAHSVAEQ